MRSTRISLAILLVLFGLRAANAEWTKQNINSFAWYHDVFFLDQEKGWIVGGDGAMLSTTDGGGTWTQSKKFTSDSLLQVRFDDESNGWLLCERDIYSRGSRSTSYLRKTTDGGRTWNTIEFEGGGRERVTKILFYNDGQATAFGEGGIFYKLQDDGVTWKKSVTAMHYLLLNGAFSGDSVGAIVGAGGTILFTEDSGLSWDQATLVGDGDTRFNSVFFAGRKGAWAVGSRGRIFHSTGGGRLWREQRSGVTADLNDVYFTSATSGWAVGNNGIIVRTCDGGNTWYDVDSHVTHRLEKIVFAGARGWAVGFGGTVLSYQDSGSKTSPNNRPMLMKRS